VRVLSPRIFDNDFNFPSTYRCNMMLRLHELCRLLIGLAGGVFILKMNHMLYNFQLFSSI